LAIKKELRAAMNGIVSAKMRAAGMPYKLVFGVELPRLSDIAREFSPDKELAVCLWNENIRECKILATLLLPHEEMTVEQAEIWTDELTTDEMAQILVMNQLAKRPWAMDVALRWILSDHQMRILCGFLIIARRMRMGETIHPDSFAQIERRAQSCLTNANPSLSRAIHAIID